MIRPIMRDPIFLVQKSAPAMAEDLTLARDLLEIFNLEDHRGDEAYAVEWAQPLEEFHRYLEDLSTRRAAQ